MVGKHLIIDQLFPDEKLLVHGGNFLLPMIDACEAAGAHVLNSFYHDFGPDQGYTFIIALAESHVSCHTWPEHNLACLDIFTCGKVEPETVFELFRTNIGVDTTDERCLLTRGRILVR